MWFLFNWDEAGSTKTQACETEQGKGGLAESSQKHLLDLPTA